MINYITKFVLIGAALLLFDAVTTLFAWDEWMYWAGLSASTLAVLAFDKLKD